MAKSRALKFCSNGWISYEDLIQTAYLKAIIWKTALGKGTTLTESDGPLIMLILKRTIKDWQWKKETAVNRPVALEVLQSLINTKLATYTLNIDILLERLDTHMSIKSTEDVQSALLLCAKKIWGEVRSRKGSR